MNGVRIYLLSAVKVLISLGIYSKYERAKNKKEIVSKLNQTNFSMEIRCDSGAVIKLMARPRPLATNKGSWPLLEHCLHRKVLFMG